MPSILSYRLLISRKVMKSISIKLSLTLPASPDTVFTTLTQSHHIRRWSQQSGRVEPVNNGKFNLFDGWVNGTVLVYKPAKRLSYTWKPSEWEKDILPSVVVYTFKSVKKGTRITLTHKGFPSERKAQSHKNGWKEFVFEPLKAYLEPWKETWPLENRSPALSLLYFTVLFCWRLYENISREDMCDLDCNVFILGLSLDTAKSRKRCPKTGDYTPNGKS